jgi:Flp pilus assembly protein TadG
VFRPTASRPRPTARRRGAAVVEMAVVTPILMLFIFGMIEFGRFIMIGQLAVNATREGDRYAVQASATPTQVKTITKQFLAGSGVSDTAITTLVIERQVSSTDPLYTPQNQGWIAVSDDDTALAAIPSGTPVRVRMSIAYSQVSWLPRGLFIASSSLISTATAMRKE